MSESRRGALYATGAYLVWGLSPLYWKLLGDLPAFQLLAHRILWCALLLTVYLAARRRLGELAAALRSRRVVATLVATTALIGTNWFLFIWAINSGHILDVSLGYFINPLVSVVLGMLFLAERLNAWQALSVAVAALGVGVLAVGYGQLPWIALILAVCFGLYGLLRKTAPVGPEVGLLVETTLLSPVMLAYLLRADAAGSSAFGHAGLGVSLLLVAAGLITAVPLLWFTHGARRLPLFAVGLLQYLAPSLHFLLAVAVYREAFSLERLVAFLFIWAALGLFTADAYRRWRRLGAAPPTAPGPPAPAPR